MNDHDLNQIFQALSDTTRRLIIDELAVQDRQSLFTIYSRMVTKYGITHSRQAFSRHLSVLEAAGIIEIEWQGTTKLHSLNQEPLSRIREGWLEKYRL